MLGTENRTLNATAVTREALRVLHQKLNFVGTITREYDDSYAATGGKVGDAATVRVLAPYTTRFPGEPDPEAAEHSLRLQTQLGEEVSFTSADLALEMMGPPTAGTTAVAPQRGSARLAQAEPLSQRPTHD